MSAIRQTETFYPGSEVRAPEGESAGRAGGDASGSTLGPLSAAEYEKWLLPPEPRNALEVGVHLASLAAGVIALTGGAAVLWFVF